MACYDHKGIEYKDKLAMVTAYGQTVVSYDKRKQKGWSTEDALLRPKGTTKLYSYEGKNYSAPEICEIAGITISQFRNRINSGWTIEQIVTGFSPKVEAVYDHKGNPYKSETAMCKAYGISRCTYRSRLDMGWSQREALEAKSGAHFETLESPIVYNGKQYYSYESAGNAASIDGVSLKRALSKGFLIEDAIRLHELGVRIVEPTYDHKGNVYASINHMCSAYGINPQVYGNKRKAGMTVEEALSLKPVKRKTPRKISKHYVRTDHLGIEYPTLTAMCKAHHTTKKRFNELIKSGATLEEALTPARSYVEEWKRTGLDGEVYPSITKLARAYKVQGSSYQKYLEELGDPKEAILKCRKMQKKNGTEKSKLFLHGKQYTSMSALSSTLHVAPKTIYKLWEMGLTNDQIYECKKYGGFDTGKGVYTDHQGNIFPSEKSMCKAHGVTQERYHRFLDKGKSLEEALTPREPGTHDHLGNWYPNTEAMCSAYNTTVNTLRGRLRNHHTLEEALTGLKIGIYVRGVHYDSAISFCRIKGVGIARYSNKRKAGLSVEEACEAALRDVEAESEGVCDHLDNWYPSINSMCRHYGIASSTYQYRIDNGMSKEQALTLPNHKVTDHKGIVYKDLKTMLNAYDISLDTYYRKKKDGIPLKEILEFKALQKDPIIYRGIEYKTYKELAEAYDLPYDRFTGCIRRGKPLEEAVIACQKPLKQDLVGQTFITRNGLECSIIRELEDVERKEYLKNGEKKRLFSVLFEDGTEVFAKYGDIMQRTIKHPTFKASSKSYLGCVDTKGAGYEVINGQRYYKCECRICHHKDLWTPREMIGHTKSHGQQH